MIEVSEKTIQHLILFAFVEFKKYSLTEMMQVFQQMSFVPPNEAETSSYPTLFKASNHIKWSIFKPATDEDLEDENREERLLAPA